MKVDFGQGVCVCQLNEYAWISRMFTPLGDLRILTAKTFTKQSCVRIGLTISHINFPPPGFVYGFLGGF